MSRRSDIGQFAICTRDVYSSGASDAAIRVYLVLSNAANQETGTCWPSLATIGKWSNKKPAAVRRALAELEEIGLIVVKPRYDELGRQSSNEYFVRTNLGVPNLEGAPVEFGSDEGAKNGRETLPKIAPEPDPEEPDQDELEGERTRVVRLANGQEPPPIEEVVAYASIHHPTLPEDQARKFWYHYSANGWKMGDKERPMDSWQSALGKWFVTWKEGKKPDPPVKPKEPFVPKIIEPESPKPRRRTEGGSALLAQVVGSDQFDGADRGLRKPG